MAITGTDGVYCKTRKQISNSSHKKFVLAPIKGVANISPGSLARKLKALASGLTLHLYPASRYVHRRIC